MARLLRSRSVVVAALAAVAIVVAVALTSAGAATTPDLPPVAADRLIASSLVAAADRSQPVSGTVQTHVDLGIPQLPAFASASGPSGLASVLLTDQTLKVWRSSDGMRVAQLLPAAERDVVVTPSDLWIWDSDRFAAWHASIPAGAATNPVPSLADVQSVASGLIARIEPYATVTTAGTEEVADRPAYLVRLTPASSSATPVDRVEVAIDAATRIPLRLEVFAKGAAEAVVRVGYTAVSFDPFDPSVLRFTPPDGAAVHELQPPDGGSADDAAGTPGEMPDVRWFGTGFDLVAAVSVPSVPKDLTPFFPFRGPIASADLVDRGDHVWIVAGLVPPDALAAVEPELR
jgi:outer membrane lipoprotein-sorting protein